MMNPPPLIYLHHYQKAKPPPMRDTIEEGSLKGALLTKLQPKDDDDSICQNTQIIQIHKETTPLQYDSL